MLPGVDRRTLLERVGSRQVVGGRDETCKNAAENPGAAMPLIIMT